MMPLPELVDGRGCRQGISIFEPTNKGIEPEFVEERVEQDSDWEGDEGGGDSQPGGMKIGGYE